MSAPHKQNVAIVGAGPAGLMAADVIASAGHAVTIYERMPSPARKFLMAGRGGLNLTHSEPLDVFVTRYGNNALAIGEAVTAFPPEHVIAWANELGQQTFVGTSGRVFPKAMKASPLLRAWLRRLDSLGVTIKLRHTWNGFAPDGGIEIASPEGEILSLNPDATLLALGGANWPRLGSDGAWVPIFENAGISVAPLEPANSGVMVPWTETFAGRFAGQPLKRMAVSVGGMTKRGEAVITRHGLEGGVIYALSRELREAVARDGQAALTIDLKPDMSIADLTTRLSRPRGSQPLTNFLRKAATLELAAIGLLREAGPLPASPEELTERIKTVRLTATGIAGLDRAISTAGGVCFAGLTPDLMIVTKPGVFVAGEMLDWESPTGGYLLQASFATGFRAAQGAIHWLGQKVKT